MAAGTVSTTASTIHTATNGQNGAKEAVAIRADDTNTVPIYLGRSGADQATVTTANGFPLSAGETMIFELLAGEGVTGIAASGTPGYRTIVVGD